MWRIVMDCIAASGRVSGLVLRGAAWCCMALLLLELTCWDPEDWAVCGTTSEWHHWHAITLGLSFRGCHASSVRILNPSSTHHQGAG